MAEFTANEVQAVQPNGVVLFTETAIAPNRSIYHREGSGIISLRGLTGCYMRFARFKVNFGGNIALAEGATVGPISLAISIDGEPEATTTMIVTPAAVGDYFNVSTETYISVPGGCCESISVENISAVAIDIQNANLIVERVA